MNLSHFRLLIVVIYFSLMIGIGLFFRKRAGTSSDAFILAEKKAPLWIVIGSIFGTWVSSATLIGYAGMGYSIGIAGYWSGGAFMLACTWLGFWAIPRLRAAGITTIPELFERYFGLSHRLVALVLLLCRDLGVVAGVALGMAIIFQNLFHFSVDASLMITAGVVVLYTITGGAWAVLVTDTLQAGLIIIGTSLLVPMSISAIGGWHEFKALIPSTHLNLLGAGFRQTTGWLLNGIFITLAYQTLLQRGLSARDTKTAKKSFVYGGLLSMIWYMLPFVLGICALILFPGIKPEEAFMKLAMIYGPYIGVFFMIVLLAACMSTISACVLTITSNISLDVYKRLISRYVTNRELVKVQRLSILAVTVTACLISRSLPYVLELLWIGGRIMAAGLAPVLMALVFWPAARRARVSTMLAMMLGSVAALIGQILQSRAMTISKGDTAFIWRWDPIIIGLPITLLTLGIGTLLETKKRRE